MHILIRLAILEVTEAGSAIAARERLGEHCRWTGGQVGTARELEMNSSKTQSDGANNVNTLETEVRIEKCIRGCNTTIEG